MSGMETIAGNAGLLEWIGETQDESILDTDLESLKDCLPYLVEAKLDGHDELESAIQCVSLTIQNLRKVRQSVSAMWVSEKKGGAR